MKMTYLSLRLMMIVLGTILISLTSHAEVEMVLLNTIYAPYNNSELAYSNGYLATAADSTIIVYHMTNDGIAEQYWQIAVPEVRKLAICNGYLVVVTDDFHCNCGLMVCDLAGQSILSSIDTSDGLVVLSATAYGNRLYVHHLETGLSVFTVGAEGEIEPSAQYSDLPNEWSYRTSCSDRYCTSTDSFHEPLVLDMSDLQNPVQLLGFNTFDRVREIGFSGDKFIVAGIDNSLSFGGIRILQYDNNELIEVYSVEEPDRSDSMIRANGEIVMMRSVASYPYVHRLILYLITGQGQLRYQQELNIELISNYLVSEGFVFIRNVTCQELLVYGIISAPHLQARLLSDHRLLLNWNSVPGASGYHVYFRNDLLDMSLS